MRDVSYIVETDCGDAASRLSDPIPWALPPVCNDYKIDSGVVAWRISNRTRPILRSMLLWYAGDMLTVARRCLQPPSPDESTSAWKKLSLLRQSPPFGESWDDAAKWCSLPWIVNNIGLNVSAVTFDTIPP